MCGEGQDALEHIAGCTWTLLTFEKLNVPVKNLVQFLALDHGTTNTKTLTLRVRALGVVYTVYNTMSHLSASSRLLLSPLDLINTAVGKPSGGKCSK